MDGKDLTKEALKAQVCADVESQRSRLIQLSLKIHSNPEIGFKERKASEWLTRYLSRNGFSVEKGICNLPTAFKATYGHGEPVIGLIAEYDALPGVGHACGHNIIGVSAAGAGVASRRIIDSYGGTVVVLGTPAEEVFGGKVLMLSAGVFEGLDVAMMVHPGVRNVVITEALACVGLDVVFVGKAAHAAAYPERGINALEAMVLSFNAINSLRQHIRSDARVHGIITYGGDAANVVPERSAASFLIRALDSSYLEELKVKVLNCFKAAALATNSQLEYKWSDIVYAPMKNNLTLAQIFAGNLESLGRRVQSFSRHFGIGSTDMGNVSQAVPAIHPTVAIATPDVLVHSPDFAIAAASEQGNKGLLDAAKAMAMTIVDIVCEPVVLSKIKDEFYGRSSQA